MFGVLGRLLAASSQRDEVVQRELEELPDAFVFSMGLWPAADLFELEKHEGALRWLRPKEHRTPTLAVRFKHISLAFTVMSFQESTAASFTSDRIIADGDITQALRIVRCLDRTMAVALPAFIARRMVKRMPGIGLGEKLMTATCIYARMARNLLAGR
jgi:hypothetical protein